MATGRRKNGRNHFGGPKDGRRDFRNMNNDGKTYNGGFGKKPAKGNGSIFGGPKDGRRNANSGKDGRNHFGGPDDGRPVLSGGKNGGSHFGGPDDGRPVGNKGKRNAPNKGRKGPGNYGAMGKYPGIPYRQAARLANAEIRAGVNDLRKDRRMVRREARNDRTRTQNLYDRSIGDLDYIFGESGDYINNQNQEIQGQYGQQRDRAAAAQSALLEALQGSNSSNMGMASDELARLGIQGSGNLGRMQADQQYGMQVANQIGSNTMANIDAQATGADAIGDLLMGMNTGSRTSRQGQALNSRNDQMFEILQNKQDGYRQVDEAISDLRGSRGDLTRQLLQQLDETGWSKFVGLGMNRRGGGNRRDRRSRNSSSSNYSSGPSYTSQSGSGSGSRSGSGGGGRRSGNGSSFNELAMNYLSR